MRKHQKIQIPSWLTAGLAVVLAISCSHAGDWPHWRGPEHSGISRETGLLDTWPPGGPPVVWRTNVGAGYSAVAVADGRLFTMGNEDGRDLVHCLDPETGETIWTYSYRCPPGGAGYAGPRATPAVDGDRVFTLSNAGDVLCLEAATGKLRWAVNIVTDLGMQPPQWGFSGSPLVDGNLLLLNAGAAGLALDKRTGAVVWSSPAGIPGYATPVVYELDGRRCAAIFAGKEMVGVDVQTGEVLWRFPWETAHDVNAADPLISGNRLFLTSGYRKGCALIELEGDRPTTIWQNTSLASQFGTPVLIDGHIYGVHGNTGRGQLKCLDWTDGRELWAEDSGFAALMAVGNRLIVLNESGTLSLWQVDPRRPNRIAQADVLPGICWTMPVLANGRLYARNHSGDLVCMDLRK